MSNKKITQIILFFIITISVYGQNRQIVTPEIESPEGQFISIFQKEKIDNPIFLSGKVKAVHKKRKSYITPNRKEENTENYHYSLNENSNITNYNSDVEYDEKNIDFLNSEKKQIIKSDTIIDDTISFTFKKGKLISKTIKTFDELNYVTIADSIHYSYKKNKVSEVKSYQKEVLVEVTETENEDTYQEDYLISDYFLTGFSEATYNKNNLLASKLAVEYDQNIMALFVENTLYNFNNDNLLIAFKKTVRSYEIIANDLLALLKLIKKDKLNESPFETNENSGVYSYDQKNRVIELEAINSDKEKQHYKIEYKNLKTIISRETNNKPDIEYHFTYDLNNNPIQEKRFVFIDGKKYLDTEIIMEINYYK